MCAYKLEAGSREAEALLLAHKNDITQRLPIDSGSRNDFTIRPLRSENLPAVQALCRNSFPIEYPECWFGEIVSGSLFSIGLFRGEELAGILVAETRKILHCNLEDRDILSDPGAFVVYILSLAVSSEYRRQGLASRLLKHLLETVVECPPYPKAVFLHVLSTNISAINFYRQNEFIHHDTLPQYYRIQDAFGDGYTYVRYTNGGGRPVSVANVCRAVASALCFPLKVIFKSVVNT